MSEPMLAADCIIMHVDDARKLVDAFGIGCIVFDKSHGSLQRLIWRE